MAVDGLALDIQSDVTELWLVQDGQEVSRVTTLACCRHHTSEAGIVAACSTSLHGLVPSHVCLIACIRLQEHGLRATTMIIG